MQLSHVLRPTAEPRPARPVGTAASGRASVSTRREAPKAAARRRRPHIRPRTPTRTERRSSDTATGARRRTAGTPPVARPRTPRSSAAQTRSPGRPRPSRRASSAAPLGASRTPCPRGHSSHHLVPGTCQAHVTGTLGDRVDSIATVASAARRGNPPGVPRRPRVEFHDAIYHVTTRGARRLPLHCCGADGRRSLEVLADVVRRFGWVCHAYCLMPNHYHLLVATPEPNLGRGMQRLNWYLALAYNRRHDRSGHAFDARYTAILIEREEHLLELCRYIVLNPVRAGLVSDPGDWEWSSYSATCGESETPAFLTTDWILSQFGTDRGRAIATYREFVADAYRQQPPPGAWHVPGTGVAGAAAVREGPSRPAAGPGATRQ
jgi:REP element-mobilizing transposase RayT